MQPHALSPAGLDAIQRVLSRPALVALDFDGTLAPITSRPEGVQVTSAVARALERLSDVCPVAVITGRALRDLTPHLPFKPTYAVGNHGAEDPQEPPADMSALDEARARLAAHASDLAVVGVTIEDKGLSLALHYRNAPDHDLAQRCLRIVLSSLEARLSIIGGKCVLNVAPVNSPDKGQALHRLVTRSGAFGAVFVGDDLNDEPAFERAPPHWVTVRVGRDFPATRARFVLDEQAQVADLLDTMAEIGTSLAAARESAY